MLVIGGAALLNADGWHEDGWCWPQTRLTLRALQSAAELRIGLWLKPEANGPSQALFTISVSGGATVTAFVELGRPSELKASVGVTAGDEVDLRIATPHRASRGEDQRDLSFILTSLTLI